MGAVSLQLGVDLLQTTDQIENLVSVHRTACWLAKMGAAAEGAGFIDHALSGARLQQGA